MKGRFLLALAQVVGITAAAMAQGIGRMPLQPSGQNPHYGSGHHDGWIAGMNDARQNNWSLPSPNFHHSEYQHGYYDGYSATRGFVGPDNRYGFGTVIVNGVQVPTDPATNYQLAYQGAKMEKEWRAETWLNQRDQYARYHAALAARHPHATPEELAAFGHARLPAPAPAKDVVDAAGAIRWPELFHRAEFDDGRTKLEGFFRKAADDPHGSGLGTQNYRDIEQAAEDMSDQLHSEIAQFSPNEYIAASKFLKGLVHQASLPGAGAPEKQ
ncbi:MAG TPA: hypothetical protein VHC22_29420 [Pirellulales bacterium]|nr:hypothetical protein [Pirellulales bacterium]